MQQLPLFAWRWDAICHEGIREHVCLLLCSETQAALPAVRWEATRGCAVLLGVREPGTKGDVGSSTEDPRYHVGPHQVVVYICYLLLCSL